MAGSNGEFQLTHTSISITGITDPVHFVNLNIQQSLAEVCSGAFSWRREGHTTLQDHLSFYQNMMGKQVDINIHDEFQFSGFITSIYLHNEDEEASEYLINFSGLPARINQFRECNSWVKKTFGKIINEINPSNNPSIKVPASDSEELFYTVQYNQTHFEFLKMMATRLGFWMYYDGKDLIFDAPSGTAIELTKERDIQQISLYSVISRTHETITGFDTYKGEAINNNQPMPGATGIIGVASSAGQTVYGSNQTSMHVAYAPNETVLRNMNTLQQQQSLSNAVMLQANSHRSTLNLGKKIKVLEANGASSGEYIITSITHNCPSADSYNNYFNFIPADVNHPPYTNSLAFPYCDAQPAIVVENEDKDGNDRIKVRFPWMKPTEMTPWLSIVTPYAGKNKGMRFLPEKDEEVMVDFLSQNAEMPYVIGTLFTNKNQSGNKHQGNHIKYIGTGTGRAMIINDEENTFTIADNYLDQYPLNTVTLTRGKDDGSIDINAFKSKSTGSYIHITNDLLRIIVMKDDTRVASISLEENGKKISIKSEGSIDLSSGSINMNAESINIKASKDLNMEGTQKGTNIKGQAISIEGTAENMIKGMTVAIEGTAGLELKGGPMASLTAALVKIN